MIDEARVADVVVTWEAVEGVSLSGEQRESLVRVMAAALDGYAAQRLEEAVLIVEHHGKNCQYASDWNVCTEAMVQAIRALSPAPRG